MTNTTEASTSPLTDPRPAFARAVDIATGVIESVLPEQLELPTPCDQMNVAGLLSHLVMVPDRVARAGRGDDPSTWPIAGPSLAPGEWAPAFRAAAADAVAEWDADDALLARMTALPWTSIPGAAVVGIYTNEVLVHAWDLAVAIGAGVDWDEAALAVASAAMHEELPDADRDPMWAAMAEHLPEGMEWAPPFVNAVGVADEATPIERLVAWSGRSPAWSAE